MANKYMHEDNHHPGESEGISLNSIARDAAEVLQEQRKNIQIESDKRNNIIDSIQSSRKGR
jgi:hypothetical protein